MGFTKNHVTFKDNDELMNSGNVGNFFEERPNFDKDENSEVNLHENEVLERSSKDFKHIDQPSYTAFNDSVNKPVYSEYPALTYEQLLEENKRLKQTLEQKDEKIRKLDEENLKMRESETKRNKDFLQIKNEHSELLSELEALRGGSVPAQLTERPHDEEDEDDKLVKLKKKVLQEKKKNERLIQEKDQLQANYEEQFGMLEERLKSQAHEYISQYNELQSEKRKLEIENQKLHDTQDVKLGDNKAAHYQSMRKDMQKLIEFKNELEALIEQQNVELGRKSEDLSMAQKELKAKDAQLRQMNDYISELERQLKQDEHKIHQTEVKFRKMKQGQIIEMNKKLRDQQSQIEILKEMVAGSKKELQSKVHNITTLKKRLGSLEKINKIHLSRHSDIQSIVSKDFHPGKQDKNNLFSQYEEDEKSSNNGRVMHHRSLERVKPIMEAKEDLEQTGRINKEQTAHFGKTLEPKKNAMINSSPQNIRVNQNLASKTPSLKLIKGASPMKVSLNFRDLI